MLRRRLLSFIHLPQNEQPASDSKDACLLSHRRPHAGRRVLSSLFFWRSPPPKAGATTGSCCERMEASCARLRIFACQTGSGTRKRLHALTTAMLVSSEMRCLRINRFRTCILLCMFVTTRGSAPDRYVDRPRDIFHVRIDRHSPRPARLAHERQPRRPFARRRLESSSNVRLARQPVVQQQSFGAADRRDVRRDADVARQARTPRVEDTAAIHKDNLVEGAPTTLESGPYPPGLKHSAVRATPARRACGASSGASRLHRSSSERSGAASRLAKNPGAYSTRAR